MKKRFTLQAAVALLLCGLSLFAQDRTISGKVTADDGSILPGVNVTLRGTSRGTTTDSEGSYKVSVPGNSKLVFSFIGFKSQEIALGTENTVNVKLVADASQLEEVVVTALGVTRSTKTLSYSAQQIKSERLVLAGENNVNNALAGKIAGVQVQSQAGSKLGSNGAGGIRIRGAGALNGKTALYVVDGTPTNVTDVNMDAIESITVLKGPNATALYGQRADAGVVVITTKKAKKTGIGIDINSNFSYENPTIVPKYQNVYAGGGDAAWLTYKWVAGQPEEWKALDGKKYHDYTDDASWGPKMDGAEYIPWYAWYPNTQYSFKTAPLTANPNNIRDFYNTGKTAQNGVTFSKAGDNFNTRISYTNINQTGITPYTSLDKNLLSTKTEINLGKYFTFGANVNYTAEKLQGENNDGYSNATSGSFNAWFHRDLDINILRELKDYVSPSGSLISWNHDNVTSTSNFNTGRFSQGNYWYNPYAQLSRQVNMVNRNKLFGDLNLTFKLDDHFKVAVFARRNELTTNYEQTGPTLIENSAYQTGYKAYYNTGQGFNREDNYEALASYNNAWGKLSLDANVGGNLRENTARTVDVGTKAGLVVPNLFALSNSKDVINYSNGRSRKKVQSLYARASLGYNETVFIEGSVRNDWSSALPKDANSYLYPSLGGSFVFSEIFKGKIPFMSFGKLRASWAQVGSDIDPYNLALTYGVGAVKYGTNILMSTPNQLPNENIQPSLSSSYEGGIDLKFLGNRIGFSATVYKEDKRNEILSVQIPGASGFSSQIINAGHIQRQGLELQLDVTAFKGKDFNWDISLNAARNTSKVLELAEGLTTYTQAAATFSQVIQVHKVGEEWGQLRGYKIKRINGEPVLTSDGFYVGEKDQYFGSVLPKFTGGGTSMMTYKNFTLNVSLDFQKGGKFYSLSSLWGKYSGLLEETAALNDKGKNVRDPVSEGGGVKVNGVNEKGEKVEMYVEGFDYYHQFYNSGADFDVYDASYAKIRELSFGYNIPLAKLGLNSYIRSASVSFIARNPWIIYVANRNIDSSEISQTYGENGQYFGTRSLGFNLKLSF
jgi:TonB-linked SusC/RagA family outer membrane protein